jgi:hypothetical protein
MHVNWMEAQYTYSSLEHSLSSWNSGILGIEGAISLRASPVSYEIKSFLPLVKKLPIFEYK